MLQGQHPRALRRLRAEGLNPSTSTPLPRKPLLRGGPCLCTLMYAISIQAVADGSIVKTEPHAGSHSGLSILDSRGRHVANKYMNEQIHA